jgi:4-hydroxybenzoate polyprenyltransferase
MLQPTEGSSDLGDLVVASKASGVPLVIDLDGTLMKSDSLDETFLDALRINPLNLWRLPIKLIISRAAVKAFLADQSPLEVETWPVHQDFLDYVKSQFDAGRKIVLATAANQSAADAVAARFPFISEVIASNSTCNMKGTVKTQRLRELFPDGFIYAGNSSEDLEVWRQGAGIVLVNAPGSVVRRAAQMGEPLAVFPRPRLTLTVLRRSLRLHQWIKNLLVFVPLVLGGKAGDASAWLNAFLGFIGLGLAASATYIVNDLWDLPNDRRHWSKITRPLASGDLPIRAGMLLALAALVIGFGLVAYAGRAGVAMLALYVAVTLSYSFFWKRVPMLDVFVLASLFTFRLGFGIVLTDVRLSPWLLVFSMFVFLSLSLAKRHTEVLGLAKQGLDEIPGRGYIASDASLTLGMGLASALGAVLVMILYLIDEAYHLQFYTHPVCLWAIPPILFLFLARVWVLSQRGQLHDDPVAFALKDRVSLILGLMFVISFVASLVGLGGP